MPRTGSDWRCASPTVMGSSSCCPRPKAPRSHSIRSLLRTWTGGLRKFPDGLRFRLAFEENPPNVCLTSSGSAAGACGESGPAAADEIPCLAKRSVTDSLGFASLLLCSGSSQMSPRVFEGASCSARSSCTSCCSRSDLASPASFSARLTSSGRRSWISCAISTSCCNCISWGSSSPGIQRSKGESMITRFMATWIPFSSKSSGEDPAWTAIDIPGLRSGALLLLCGCPFACG
mmetsp:Transcript_73498/g.139752  ORF Transcript_73498/g.139752 Transcript_73498/m.139752 type:complete len:233 (+) Transcript_73498:1730-2428(+)